MTEAAGAHGVTDHSLLLGFYRRFLWDPLVARVPASISPNSLTVVAQLLGALSAVFALFASRGPRGLYLAAAACIFASLTLDNIDGSHARLTGQSSRRGEMLDHGLDGITSTSVLISTGLLLHLDALWMCSLCALGALTFAATFWEQSRTGALTLPAIGPTEGVSALVVVEVSVALFGDPDWLRVSRERVTGGTVLVVVLVAVHAVAVLPPLVRARRHGVPLRDFLPPTVISLALMVYGLLGAPGPLVGATIGLTCAHFVCHLVIARHVDRRSGKVSKAPRTLFVALLPISWALVSPESVTACATLAMLVAVVAYARSLQLGWRELAPRVEPS